MFNIDDEIKIKDSNLYGVVKKIFRNKEAAYYIVLVNNTLVRIAENSIEKSTRKQEITRKSPKITYSLVENNNFVSEIMLRHQTVDEAIMNLDKFIDEAICNRVKRLKIIHGKHGGILRNAVHEYLKNNEYVKEFNLGEYFEGSYGVTIAILK